jgi:CheY-like chemotaxis protein
MAQVLIAEDEAFTAMALVDELERLGHTVRDAPDGAVALQILQDFTPDVVVTDLMMPNVDGAGLIRSLRARSGPTIPVVLITGVPQVKLPDGLAYDAYLGKPVDYRALGRLIERLAR